jgi:hypothetical protein
VLLKEAVVPQKEDYASSMEDGVLRTGASIFPMKAGVSPMETRLLSLEDCPLTLES